MKSTLKEINARKITKAFVHPVILSKMKLACCAAAICQFVTVSVDILKDGTLP